ncbi:hypothetical protein [Riemerella columbina]|uniref:hypothetical protein n=1 Tax=Riemerella columbina TaxID=103810 RepID=UPI00037832FB|nr:hypothetical protein [Riemerella columbina]
MKPKFNDRMLQLPDLLIEHKVIRFKKEFTDAIGIKVSGFNRIKNKPSYNFTPEQIHKAGDIFNINYNWIFGISEKLFQKKNRDKELKKCTDLKNQ